MEDSKPSSRSADAHAAWKKMQDPVNGEQVLVRADSLDIASVIAVAKYVIYTHERFRHRNSSCSDTDARLN
jgi:hypothetical protein